MSMRWHNAVLTLLILALLLGVPWSGPVQARQNGGGFPRTVVDGTGTAVFIPTRPDRIAVIGEVPGLRHVVPADSRIAVDPVDLAGVDWTCIGLLVVPDLYAAAFSAPIAAVPVPVFRTTQVRDLADWRDQVRRLGEATGRESTARAAVGRLDAVLTVVALMTRHLPTVRVLVVTPEAYTFGQHAFVTALITAAGGTNVAAAAGYDDFRQIDDGAVRLLAPEVILLSPTWPADAPANLTANPAYAGVPAVTARRIFRLPFLPTQPRDPAAAIITLAVLLHLPLALPAF